MEHSTEVLIIELSDKLGTTSEHLWGVLVAQAPIYAVSAITLHVCVFTAMYFLVRFVLGKTTVKEGENSAEWNEEGGFFAWVFVAIFSLLEFLALVVDLSRLAGAIFNPEYWALQQLL